MSKLVSILMFLGVSIAAITAGAGEYPQVAEYSLDASFVPQQASMTGWAEVRFAADSDLSPKVSFFLHGELRVDSILQGGVGLEFEQAPRFYDKDYTLVAKAIEVQLQSTKPEEPLTVFYGGYFNPSKVRSDSDYMRIDPSGVYLRAYYYSPWFPIFEEPEGGGYKVDFKEVTLRSPEEFSTVFVGHLIDEEILDNERVTTWRAKNVHLAYAQCTMQRFQRFSEGGVQVYSWTDSASLAAAESIVQFVRDVASRFRERYGQTAGTTELYVAEMPEYGDISSDNVTTITFDAWQQFDSETWPKRFLGHELVHPYVRPPVAYDDPMAAMVIEAFPSYFHLPVLQEYLGDDWYRNLLAVREERYLKMKASGLSRRGRPLPVEKPLDQITFDEIGDYKDLFILNDRALLFLNFLRVKMGDSEFWRFSHELCNVSELTDPGFRGLVVSHLPGFEDDLHRWLSTNEYPDRWHLENLTAGR